MEDLLHTGKPSPARARHGVTGKAKRLQATKVRPWNICRSLGLSNPWKEVRVDYDGSYQKYSTKGSSKE
ncbi:hypothetical protein PG984_009104 [Apiospora sp. TS-2023a]